MKAKPAVISFLLGFILLLPFSATPIGNKVAAASPALSWIGWVSRNLLSGGGLGYVVGVLFGALIYLLLRRVAAGASAAQA
jgi:ABC-type transport system involved in cytochrome c biogenesis permease component